MVHQYQCTMVGTHGFIIHEKSYIPLPYIFREISATSLLLQVGIQFVLVRHSSPFRNNSPVKVKDDFKAYRIAMGAKKEAFQTDKQGGMEELMGEDGNFWC